MSRFIKEFKETGITDVPQVGGKTLLWAKCFPNFLRRR